MLIPLGLGVKVPKFPFITIYLVILNVFFFLQQEPLDFKAIEQMVSKKQTSSLISYYKSKDLLNKENISVSSLFKAQFSHGSWAHLIGNMLALIGFGLYAETKLGALSYLFVYFLGGSLGLGLSAHFFLRPDSVLMGASANIFSMMGAFFVIFFRHYMKFLLFYIFIWKKILLPVRFSFPFFFILVEVTNQFLGGGNVAHDAHLIGIGIGVFCGFIFILGDPIKWPFIYAIEREKFDELAGKTNFGEIVDICNDILNFNPVNYKVRFFLLSKAIERFQKGLHLDKHANEVLKNHLERYIGKFIKEKKYDLCNSLLKKIPYDLPIFLYLEGLSQRKIIKFGDYLLDERDYCGALRIYQLFFYYYPKSKNAKNLLRTCDGVLEAINKKEDWEKVKMIKDINPENILSLRIKQYLEIKEEKRY